MSKEIPIIVRRRSNPVIFRVVGYWSGGDNEVVVVDDGIVAQLDFVALRMNSSRTRRGKSDVLVTQHAAQVDADILAAAPVHRDPWIGRHELEAIGIRYHGDLFALFQQCVHLEGHRYAADTAAQDNNVSHNIPVKKSKFNTLDRQLN